LFDPPGRPLFKLPGANRRWRLPFRYRGSRRESAVAQLFSLGSMSNSKLFLLIGAFVCGLIGAYIAVMAAVGIVTQPIRSLHDLLIAGYLVIYALLAFVPFCAFIYPRFKTSRKSVFVGSAVIEVLVLAFFLCAILFPRL
jgi:hypothetical protein